MLGFLFLILSSILLYILYRVLSRNKQISTRAEIVNLALEIIKPRKFLKKAFTNPLRTNLPFKASKRFSDKYNTVYHNIDGTELMTANSNSPHNNIHILYFHGGAYVLGKNGVKGNESFISSLIDTTGAKVTFVDYPVAPETKYNQTLEKVYETYAYLSTEYSSDKLILVGDSAGGGLALSLAQMIKERQCIRRPEKIVLFSPWLDLSLENTEMNKQENKDMILSKEALLYAAKQYAEPNEFKNPLVSPIYGDFRELCSTLMFFGSYELFLVDGLRVQRMVKTDNLDICLRFYDEMPHDWVIFPLPEAKEALKEASEFIHRYNPQNLGLQVS